MNTEKSEFWLSSIHSASEKDLKRLDRELSIYLTKSSTAPIPLRDWAEAYLGQQGFNRVNQAPHFDGRDVAFPQEATRYEGQAGGMKDVYVSISECEFEPGLILVFVSWHPLMGETDKEPSRQTKAGLALTEALAVWWQDYAGKPWLHR